MKGGHFKTPSSLLHSHHKQVLLSDLDGGGGGRDSDDGGQGSQYRGLGLRESDFEQHYENPYYAQNANYNAVEEQQWPVVQEEEDKVSTAQNKIVIQKPADDDLDNQERTFMGSVKGSNSPRGGQLTDTGTGNKRKKDGKTSSAVVLASAASSHSKKKSQVKDDPVKKNIVAMFDEEAEKNPKKKVHKTQMVQEYERQAIIVATTSDDQESDSRNNRRAAVAATHQQLPSKKKKKKRPTEYEKPVEEEEEYIPTPQYNNRMFQENQQYGGTARQGWQRPTSAKSNFDMFQQNFYPQRSDTAGMSPFTGRSQGVMSKRSNFEPQFISRNPAATMRSTNRMLMPALPLNQDFPDEFEKWVSKPTQQGFLYFHLKGTKTYQWNFPRFYDPEIRKTRPYFVDHWVKKYDNRGKKYWQNMHSKHIQHVKPDSETYLIQASIAGNLAFIELYLKSEGELVITDQQRRTALHHSCSNGHREITAMLAEFSYPLLESQDINGCTPIFMATRYNEVECLKLLISYDSNLFHKMRNGDTVLHVAAAYNSLECMIILTNFGGMELFVQKNRYGLKAIDIAKKMRNYECFEVLQKLERNVTYQNALLEREVQALDTIRPSKSYRVPATGADMGYRGGSGNYLEMAASSRRQQMVTPQSSRRGDFMSPMTPLNPRSIQQQQYTGRQQRGKYVNQDDSSFIVEEASGFDLPMEDPDEADQVFESLGGRQGYQKRMQDYDRLASTIKHERRYLEKMKLEKKSTREDKHERTKRAHDIEFDDYRKSLQEGVIQSQAGGSKKKLKKIQEEESQGSSAEERERVKLMSKRSTVKIMPSAGTEEEGSETVSEQPFRTQTSRKGTQKSTLQANQATYRSAQSSGRRQFIADFEEEEDVVEELPQKKYQEVPNRNQSMFKLSIRDDGSLIHRDGNIFSNQNTSRQRGKSATARNDGERLLNEGSQRYLQRHIAHQYSDEVDEENLRPSPRRPRTLRSEAGLGDPWKVSRSRERNRGNDIEDDNEDDAPKPSLVEIAYDKTSSIVSSMKGFLFTGFTKIKEIIGGQTGRDKSRTSRSQKKDRRKDGSISSESSMDRYKTPMGRSKSRGGFSKVVPIDALNLSDPEDNGRNRQVNFNINRVVGITPEREDNNSIDRGQRSRSVMSQRAFNTSKTVQIQAESFNQAQQVKSAMKKTPREPSFHSAKSVGVGSHKINEESENAPQVPGGGASSSNQEHLLLGPTLPMQQSISSQPNSMEFNKQEARVGIHQTEKKKNANLKANQLNFHKAYQSSEERGVVAKGIFRNNNQVNGPTGEDNWQQLSPSSRNSSQQRDVQILPADAVTYRTTQFRPEEEKKHMELARQLASDNGGKNPLAMQQLKPPESKGPASGTGGVKTTGASTHKKSTSVVGSINSQRRGAPLSQEQFEMIMMNSEQEEGKHKMIGKDSHYQSLKDNKNSQMKSLIPKPEEKQDDLQKFYEELIGNNSISIQIATNLPANNVDKNDLRVQEIMEETNLSNLYNRIMGDHQNDIPSKKSQPQKKDQHELKDQKKQNVAPPEQQEVSLLTEFNPPTQRLGISLRYDMSFQSGITEIKKALDEEENFDNVSDCSFIEEDPAEAAKKINAQIAQSNILDKGQFLASQNSLHQSMGWSAQNNSQIAGAGLRQSSAATRPIMGIQMLNQNNSMHFNAAGLGNSFRYQSDNEDTTTKNNQPLLSRKGSVNDLQLTPQKKSAAPLSQLGLVPSNAPKSAIGLQQMTGGGSSSVNLRASQSQNPNSLGQQDQTNHVIQNLAPSGSALSDNTSNSAAVVIQSQNSYLTRQLSTEPKTMPAQPEYQDPQKQQIINLFLEDGGIVPTFSPTKALPTTRPTDETQTDLESGYRKPKQGRLDFDSQQATFQGLSSISEENKGQSEQASEINTKEIKKEVMKKLIQIMDEEEDEPLNDDDEYSVKKATRDEQQPSDSDRFIERHAKDDRPQQKFLGGAAGGSRSGSTARKNTRYGERDDSMINFDLTSSKIVDHREDFDEEPVRKVMEEPILAQMTNRKSLKLQLQEQIQSIVVSESSSFQSGAQTSKPQAASKKTQMEDLEAGVMPLVILKPALDAPYKGEASSQLSGEDSPDLESSSQKKRVPREYNLRLQAFLQQKQQKVASTILGGDTSQDSILQELDSISRIYNEIVPEESKEEAGKPKISTDLKVDTQFTKQQERKASSQERQQQLPVGGNLKRKTSEGGGGIQGDSPVPALWPRKEGGGSLPPLNRVQSEDEGDNTGGRVRGMQEIFYPKEAPESLREGTPTRRSDNGGGNQESIGTTNVGYLQWAREDKQNRSTAAIPLYGAGFSSDEDGGNGSKTRQQNKMQRLLSKYQLHSTSVLGNAPLYQQSPSTAKNTNQNIQQQQQQANVTPFQTQKTIRDVSFKSHNVSTHTDNGERLKENLKLFTKNRLLGNNKSKDAKNIQSANQDQQK